MAKLKILKIGDETLRRVSRPVDAITPRILTLIDDMVQTMRAADGVGLAAPQVGVLRRAGNRGGMSLCSRPLGGHAPSDARDGSRHEPPGRNRNLYGIGSACQGLLS